MSNTISLMVSDHCLLDFITISYLLLISDICSSILTFGPASQKWPILTTKKVNMRAEKKDFLRDDIDMCFLQKTGFKLIKFGLCGSIYILHPAIGGSHPVPCLSTQIAERQGTAMYYQVGEPYEELYFCKALPLYTKNQHPFVWAPSSQLYSNHITILESRIFVTKQLVHWNRCDNKCLTRKP